MAKHATKYNIKSYYNKFIRTLEIQEEPLKAERKNIYIIKSKLYKKVLPYKSDIKTIEGLLKTLRSIQYSPNLYSEDIYNEYEASIKDKLESSLAINIIAIFEYTRRDKQCKIELQYIESYKINSGTYKVILDNYYGHISKWILRGYVFRVGKHLGRVYIKETYKNFTNEFGETRGIVNHAASITLLENIAKQQEEQGLHSLYSDYKNRGYYNKKQFIHLMKPYTYSPSEPDLPKWIIYHTDDWIPYFRWDSRDYTMGELKQYTFKPTSFINTPSRNKTEFMNNVTNVDDIIDCELLGAKDKMFLIKRFDKTYYKLTRNDIS